MRVLAIDPSVQSLGWAVMSRFGDHVKMVAAGLERPSKEISWSDRAMDMAATIELAVRHHKPARVFIEMPEFFDEAVHLMKWKTGDMIKLSYVVGAIASRLEFHGYTVQLIPVRQWKGQLPKAIVQRRVTKILGIKTCKKFNLRADMWDAAGIALWALGKL